MSYLKDLSQVEYLDTWGNEISSEGVGYLKMFYNLSFSDLAWICFWEHDVASDGELQADEFLNSDIVESDEANGQSPY